MHITGAGAMHAARGVMEFDTAEIGVMIGNRFMFEAGICLKESITGVSVASHGIKELLKVSQNGEAKTGRRTQRRSSA